MFKHDDTVEIKSGKWKGHVGFIRKTSKPDHYEVVEGDEYPRFGVHHVSNLKKAPNPHIGEEATDLDEAVLSVAQRQKRAQIMRRYQAKIERSRELAKKRLAPKENIKKRAYAQARQIVRQRVAGKRGAEYEKLGPSEKIAIDRAVEGKQKLIKKIALRLIPRVKAAEQQRLHTFMKGQQLQNHGQPEGKTKEPTGSGHSSVQEELNNFFAENFPPTAERSERKQPRETTDTVARKKGGKEVKGNKNIIQYNKFEEERDCNSSAYKAIAKKANKSGISEDILGEVYNRGMYAWAEETGVSQQQYAFARVNSYINQGKTYFNEDADLHEGRAPGTPSIKRYKRPDGTTALKSLNKWGKRKDWRDTEGGLAKAREHAGVNTVTEEEQQTNENFMDGKGPGKPGDSARHGLKGKSASELRKIRSSETASPRKKQLAHWMLNMHHNEETELDEAGSKYNIPMARVKPKKAPTRTFGSVLDEVDVPVKHLDRARSVWNRTKDVEAVKKFVSSVKEETELDEKRGLWDNIHAKRKRIEAGSGERMRKPGSKGAPTAQDFKDAQEAFVSEEERIDPKIKVEGTNCRNCVYWRKDLEKPVTKEELNPNGGLKAPNKEYIAMSKRIDLGTLPGKDSGVKVKGFCDHDSIKDWVTERMCCSQWDSDGMIRDYKGQSPVMEADGEPIKPQTTSPGSKHRKKIENVDRDTPHTEHGKQQQIQKKIIDEGGNSQPDPKKRLVGTDSLVKAYKKDTPGQSLDESFNIAFASGVGVTLTAADLGMRAQGAFALHPSVIEEMERRAAEDMEEEVRTVDVKGVVVHTAAGKTVIRKQKVNRKIIGSGNLTDGKPDDTL